MPTSHARIALTRDADPDDEPRRARPISTEGPELDAWLDERGAPPAMRSTQEVLSAASKRRRVARVAISEALQELRGEQAGLRVSAPAPDDPPHTDG